MSASTTINTPDRYELFVLPGDAKKLEIEKDTRIPNAATFKIQLEDHTLGNLLRMEMLRQSHVQFAGYKVPHPLEHYFLLKVQTSKNSTPVEALKNGINQLITDISSLEAQFQAEMGKFTSTNQF